MHTSCKSWDLRSGAKSILSNWVSRAFRTQSAAHAVSSGKTLLSNDTTLQPPQKTVSSLPRTPCSPTCDKATQMSN
eukprot:3709803-Amphidinium_carterae.1